MRQEAIVRLKIVSAVHTPEEIGSALGLSCDRCWHIGDARPHTIIREKENGWLLGSGRPKSAPLEEHIDALLSVLEGCADAVAWLSAKSEVVISCVIYADSPPPLYFDGAVISRLSRLGSGLDIDLYIDGADSPL